MKQKIFGICVSITAAVLMIFLGIQLLLGKAGADDDYVNTVEASGFSEEELISLLDKDDAVLCYTPDADAYREMDNGCYYIDNMIQVYLKQEAAKQDKLDLVSELDGSLIGLDAMSNSIQIKVQSQSQAQLQQLCDEISDRELVIAAYYDMAFPVENTSPVPQNLLPKGIPADDFGEWGGCDWEGNWNQNNWAWEAIDAPKAWSYEEYFSPICIGVIDGSFKQLKHEELEHLDILQYGWDEKVVNTNGFVDWFEKIIDIHGLEVTGIIAAKAGNEKGLAGMVQDISELRCITFLPHDLEYIGRNPKDGSISNMGMVLTVLSRVEYSISKLVTPDKNGDYTRVINLSQGHFADENGVGIGEEMIAMSGQRLSQYLLCTLETGRRKNPSFDFLVVKSAGNGVKNEMKKPCESMESGMFAAMTEENCIEPGGRLGYTKQDILDHVLVVSSFTHRGNEPIIDNGASFGQTVDILAPGRDIYCASTGFFGRYEVFDGTSLSAPFVTGTAALVWSVDPTLTAQQVKGILLESSEVELNAPDVDGMFRDEAGNLYHYPILNAGNAVEMAVNMRLADADAACSICVVDKQTGESIEGAHARLLDINLDVFSDPYEEAFTDSDGRCTFTQVADKQNRVVVVNAEGYEEYSGSVTAMRLHPRKTEAPYYDEDISQQDWNVIELIPEGYEKETVTDTNGLQEILAALIDKYGIIAEGTDEYTQIANERLDGLLCADIYDYDDDGEDELLTLRVNPYTDEYKDELYLAVYEDDGDTTPADEVMIPRIKWSTDLPNNNAIHVFRYEDVGPCIGLDNFYNMNSQSFGMLSYVYHGDELSLQGGVDCDEYDSGGYVWVAENEKAVSHNALEEDSGWVSSCDRSWGDDYSPKAKDVPEYLGQYLKDLKKLGLTDKKLRSLHGTNTDDAPNITLNPIGGSFQNIFYSCQMKPADHYDHVQNLGGIAAAYGQASFTLTCYGNLGKYQVTDTDKGNGKDDMPNVQEGRKEVEKLFDAFAEAFKDEDGKAIADLYYPETVKQREDLENLWTKRLEEGHYMDGADGIKMFALSNVQTLSDEEIVAHYSTSIPEDACTFTVAVTPDWSEVWPEWIAGGIELYAARYGESWYLIK